MDLSIVANTIYESMAVKVIISVIVSLIILVNHKKLLLWLPFLPYTAIWTYSTTRPLEWMFVGSYIEFLLVTLLLIRGMVKGLDKMSLWLLGMIMLSLPSFVNAGEHFCLSLFYFVCLLSGAGVYKFFKDNMEEMLAARLMEQAVLIWMILGMIMKIYITVRHGGFFLVERGGGALNSLHIAETIFLLLPFVTKMWLLIAVIVFLLMQCSKSIFLTLLFYAMMWSLVDLRKSIKVMLILLLLLVVSQPLLNLKLPYYGTEGYQYSFSDFFFSRFGNSIEEFREKIIAGDRVQMNKIALEVAKDTMFFGSGLGSSTFELMKRGAIITTSNYHNMYATILAEGGLLFFLGFIGFSIYLLQIALKIDKRVFVGLISWYFFGMLTGWIYSGGSCIDYYMLMFIVAYLSYVRRKKYLFKRKPLLPNESFDLKTPAICR